jgi:hypothetical protein
MRRQHRGSKTEKREVGRERERERERDNKEGKSAK